MSIEEEIFHERSRLAYSLEDKKRKVVVYLGDAEWREFRQSINQITMVRDDLAYLGKSTMYDGAQIFRVIAPSHYHVTTMPI